MKKILLLFILLTGAPAPALVVVLPPCTPFAESDSNTPFHMPSRALPGQRLCIAFTPVPGENAALRISLGHDANADGTLTAEEETFRLLTDSPAENLLPPDADPLENPEPGHYTLRLASGAPLPQWSTLRVTQWGAETPLTLTIALTSPATLIQLY